MMVAEALGLLGLSSAMRVNMIKGSGANSKSRFSDLRANVTSDCYRFVSTRVFETDEEFRKQACDFA